MTELCGSCGKGLRDSDRFCDRCGAAQPTRSRQPESHRRPAESVPRTEVDSLRTSLVAKISDLEAKLSESMPRQEVDKLHVRLRQLESLLAESVPRREAKAESDSLRMKVAQLHDRLAELVPKTELETKVNELATAKKAIEDLKGQLSRSSIKIEELQSKLSDSVPRKELETMKNRLESKILGLETESAVSIPRSEEEELRDGAPAVSRSPQTLAQRTSSPKCPLCKYKNRPDAIYCTSCGHKLKDETEQAKPKAKPSSTLELAMMSTDELTRVARKAAGGGVYLFVGNASSTVILAVGIIIVARLLGPHDYGLYTLALTIPTLLAALSDVGMSYALVRLPAKSKSEGDPARAFRLIRLGFLLKLAVSTVAFLICYAGSALIATAVFSRPELTPFIQLAALLIVFQAIYDATTNSFNGQDLMQYSAAILVLQGVLKGTLGPTLVFIGLGITGAISGYVLALAAAGATGAAILFTRHARSSGRAGDSASMELRALLAYGLPLYLAAVVTVFLTQYQNIVLAHFASNVEIGNFGATWNFVTFMTILSYPITTAMFPMFSKMDPKSHRGDLARGFALAVKYASLLMIPASVAVMVFSRNLIYLTYGSGYALAPQYLVLLAALYLLTAISYLVLGSFLNGIADTGTVLKMSVVTLAVYLPLGPVLAWVWGPFGLLIAYILSNATSTLYGLRQASVKHDARPNLKAGGKIILSALVAAVPTIGLIQLDGVGVGLVNLVAGGLLYAGVYLTLAPILGAVEKQDILNLRTLLGSTRIVALLVSPVFDYESKLLSAVKRK